MSDVGALGYAASKGIMASTENLGRNVIGDRIVGLEIASRNTQLASCNPLVELSPKPT